MVIDDPPRRTAVSHEQRGRHLKGVGLSKATGRLHSQSRQSCNTSRIEKSLKVIRRD